MSRNVKIPRAMVDLKPPQGAACNRCGVCCWVEVCDLGERVLGVKRETSPCPALMGTPGASSCGLVVDPARFAPEQAAKHGVAAMSAAALLIISAGEGCDARINGEPRNREFLAKLDKQDKDPTHRGMIDWAFSLWKR